MAGDLLLLNMTLLPSSAETAAAAGEDFNNGLQHNHSLPSNETSLNDSSLQSEMSSGVVPSVSIPEAVIMSLLMSLCIAVTIVGNILVILSVFTYRPLRSVQNFFIVSLAVADTAVAILVMPFNVADFVIGHWVFGAVWCNIWLTSDILMCTASILNLCAIAVDRFYAIHDPINYAQKRTMKRVLIYIAVVWVLSVLISVPPLLGWNNSSGRNLYNEETMICRLTDSKSFVIYSSLGSFYIPLFIMTFVYVNIFRATRRRLRERAKQNAAAKLASATGKTPEECTQTNHHSKTNQGADVSSSDSPEHTVDKDTGEQRTPEHQVPKPSPRCFRNGATSKEDKEASKKLTKSEPVVQEKSQMHQFYEEKARISLSKERRAARTMAIIMVTFVVCWLPFFLMYVIFPFCPSCQKTDGRIVNFIVWLGYINSSLNPVIYTIFNIDFRRAFKRLLQGKCSMRA